MRPQVNSVSLEILYKCAVVFLCVNSNSHSHVSMLVPELRTCGPTLLMLEQFASGCLAEGETDLVPIFTVSFYTVCSSPIMVSEGLTTTQGPAASFVVSSLTLSSPNLHTELKAVLLLCIFMSLSEPTVAIAFFCCLSACLSLPTTHRLWLWFILSLSHSMPGQGPTSGQASGPDPDIRPARDRILYLFIEVT